VLTAVTSASQEIMIFPQPILLHIQLRSFISLLCLTFFLRSRFGLVISGSGSVPFTTLYGYVRRGQQGEIERIHHSPTNTKYRLKSFCEVGYAKFRPNIFAAGKRISMVILVAVGLHA